MISIPQLILISLAGYLVGSFPTGVVLSRRKYRIDVRDMGSGNIGATNVTRVFGWWAGVVTLTIDFLKGFIPLRLISIYAPEWTWLFAVTGIALVLGHCFSLFLGFRGGKGVATSLGCIAVADPLLALICVVVYLVLLWVTKISAVGSLGCVLVAMTYVFSTKAESHVVLLLGGICGLILVRHYGNIRRLIRTVAERRGA